MGLLPSKGWASITPHLCALHKKKLGISSCTLSKFFIHPSIFKNNVLPFL